MNRLDTLKTGGKHIVFYLMAGDPDMDSTYSLVRMMEKNGVSAVELGIPFSDPVADGPAIQRAGLRALKKGVNISKTLELVTKLRAEVKIPLIAMTYYNIILSYGVKKFVDDSLKAGLDGAIIPDLPFDEEPDFYEYALKKGFYLIYLAAPSNTDGRIKKIVEKTRGFVYYILLKGVTGSGSQDKNPYAGVKRVKRLTKKAVFAGFGISEPAQAAAALKYADGAIIGSAFVSLCEKYGASKKLMMEKAEGFVKKFTARK